MIPLPKMLEANIERGNVKVFMRGYKRYRVSSQRFSKKPLNIEFVLAVDTQSPSKVSIDELQNAIEEKEASVLSRHPEYVSPTQHQLMLFEGRILYHVPLTKAPLIPNFTVSRTLFPIGKR